MNIVNATTAFDENPATRAQIAQLIETSAVRISPAR